MTIPSEAIIATLDDGTLVCWLHKLPDGTNYSYLWDQHEAGTTQQVHALNTRSQVPVFVAPPTYTIELTEAEAKWVQESINVSYYETDEVKSLYSKITEVLTPEVKSDKQEDYPRTTIDTYGPEGEDCESCGWPWSTSTGLEMFLSGGHVCCGSCRMNQTHNQDHYQRKATEKITSKSRRKETHDSPLLNSAWTDGKHLILNDPSLFAGRYYGAAACSAPSTAAHHGLLGEVTCGNCKRTKAYKEANK